MIPLSAFGNNYFGNNYYCAAILQELLAHGICNVFGANFSSYTTCVSLSRSVVQENLGGRSQVSGLFSCFILLLVLLWLAPFFEPLPDVRMSLTNFLESEKEFMR